MSTLFQADSAVMVILHPHRNFLKYHGKGLAGGGYVQNAVGYGNGGSGHISDGCPKSCRRCNLGGNENLSRVLEKLLYQLNHRGSIVAIDKPVIK